MRERLRRFVPPIDLESVGAGQTPLSLGVVSLVTAAGLAGAVVGGVSPFVLGLAVVSGVASGLGSRWLSGDRGVTLILGGSTMVIAGGVGMGSLGVLVATAPGGITSRPVSALAVDGIFWVSSVAVGLGAAALVADSFDRERIDAALRRYAIATLGFILTVVVGGAAIGGFDPAGANGLRIGQILDVAIGLLVATADPNAAAGPTLLVLFVGLRLVRRAVASDASPLVFAEQTRDRIQRATDRITRATGWISLGVLLAGLGLVRAHIVGLLSSPPVATTVLGQLVTVTGSSVARHVALGVCVLGIVGLVLRSLFAIWIRGLSEQILGAALPLAGIIAVTGGLVAVSLSAPLPLPQRVGPVSRIVSLPSGVAVGLAVSVGATVMAALFLAAVFVLWDALPRRTPGLAVLASGLVGLAVEIAASDGTAVAVFTLVAVTLVVVDVGRVGSSMATEVGRRNGVRVELVNGAATLGIGTAAVALAVGLNQIRFTATLGPLSYLLGAVSFVVAFVLFGRVLST